MKANVVQLCRDLESDLDESVAHAMEKVMSKDGTLCSHMDEFEQRIENEELYEEFQNLRDEINALRRYARLARLKLEGDCVQEAQGKLSEFGDRIEQSSDYQKAVLEIEEEMHEAGGVGDVLKSLLMWKPSPDDRIK